MFRLSAGIFPLLITIIECGEARTDGRCRTLAPVQRWIGVEESPATVLVGVPKIPGGLGGPSSIKPAVRISLAHGSRHRNFGWFVPVRSDMLIPGCMDLTAALALLIKSSTPHHDGE